MANTVSGPRFFDSSAPFNPINPHGAKARMPDGWKSPLKEPLYQVFVEDHRHGCIPIGPKIGNAIASELCATVQTSIAAGKITGWTNPHVMPAPAEQVRRRVLV